ncbi:MAG: hypothetical protein KKE02_19930 [Alphaproteobacteria bacterium]|nr:hypothetical protein [Alphaproteobacteria bacterium]MBU1514742.1 hypothetical protein [Alphaproteobacteria bacterium]MBU2093873.1 hypothetical protein [Alphaproteobacteria bacterium]MBU2153300.1 hypothetical protein [Alphaproteobacteria bacterium]MBU2309728.1 hypothetical protein [Alphaproteobacteria bacterium]
MVLLMLLVAASCEPTREYVVTPSPDRAASLILEVEFDTLDGEPRRELSLSGGKFDDRFILGPVENNNGLGWLDDTTVNVCPLRRDERLPLSVPLISEDGVRRTYQVVAQCTPAWVGEPKLQPSVEGFDFPAASAKGH